MNILFASESYWMKGVVYDLHILAEGLAKLGHKVYAVDPGENAEIGTDSAQKVDENEIKEVSRVFDDIKIKLISPDFRVYGFFAFLTKNFPDSIPVLKTVKIYGKIDDLLKKEKIDVIVLYSVARTGIPITLLAKKHNIPVVFRNVDMLHHLWPTKARRLVVKLCEKWVYPRMDKLLALTPKYADYLCRMKADRSKMDMLLFPLDTDTFTCKPPVEDIRKKWGYTEEDQVIVFVGTFYAFGGLAQFVRCFPEILKQCPNAKLLLVGDGPLRPSIEEAITEFKLEKYVTITGYLPFSEMPSCISIATICLNVFPLTEVTKDLFSAKIVQYLACGKATVSSDLPGISTLIPGERAGVIFVKTIPEMVGAVASLLNSAEKRECLGRAGREYAQKMHSYERVIQKAAQVLEEMIENKKVQCEK